MIETENSVRRVKDDWLEIDARASSDNFPIDPIQIRPGNADDAVVVSNVSAIGSEVRIGDLRLALERIEAEF